MIEKEHKCRKCGDVLVVGENWYPSAWKNHDYICNDCHRKQYRSWREENYEKAKANSTRNSRNRGHLSMEENKDCAQYLGVTVNERLIRHRFKDVIVMPYGHPGFDFICNKGMMVDGKSSCLRKDGRWSFMIRQNTEADFFLCVAYDNIDDLNIAHVWMIPGRDVNHLTGVSISPSTVHKWDKYIYDIEGFSSCCNEMKNEK